MTVRQIIQEIEALPAEGRREVLSSLQERVESKTSDASKVTFADHNEAMRIADRIFTERAELFQKLAQ
jgi:hypothetical protein